MNKSRETRVDLILLNELKEQLISIGLSLKPCHLWEICFGDCHQVLRVCSQLNIHLNHLNIIQINDYIFIANIECLRKHLNNILKESFNALINVSPNLPFPQLLNSDEMRAKKNTLKLLCNELELHSKDPKDQNFKIECLSEGYADMCFIFGSLLGYPVIYCNEMPSEGNCLSCVPLCAYSVNRLSQSHSFPPIYSFSLPKKYRNLFYSDINLWFTTLNDFCNKGLVLKEEITSMAYVLT